MRTNKHTAFVCLLGGILAAPGMAQLSGTETRVTGRTYVRQDGGADATLSSCNDESPGSTAAGNRQQNEPTVAINPQHPNVIVSGANDYCTVPTIGDAWMGFYVSTNSGATWVNSLNPGYPTDTSTAGQASPIFQRDTNSGDPVMDWDNQNRLFYGGIAFNRTATNASGLVQPTNANFIVSTWEYDPSQPLGMRYLRTVIVGPGTPARFPVGGRFNDKPSLHVDDWPGSPHNGNIYATWTLFPGNAGADQILFARSTDHGQSFSKPMKISMGVASAQGSDVTVAPDGTIYIVWRQFATFQQNRPNAIVFVKSTDGGQTFTNPAIVQKIIPYDREDLYVSDGAARECGSGTFLCVSHFAFHRVNSEPNAVVDASGNVYVTWEELSPVADNGDTYHPDGQSRLVISKSTNGGASWSAAVPIDPQAAGHQWWPNLEYDKTTGTIVAIYYDSRFDPSYSPYRPPGNLADGTSVCGSPGSTVCDVLNTFVATSKDGGGSWTSARASTIGHQPEYEIFGNRQDPFHGDYLWVDANGGFLYGVWTDNRDVVPGIDPRETPDGFDVHQCRADPTAPDTCPNAGGLNQNIYGIGALLP